MLIYKINIGLLSLSAAVKCLTFKPQSQETATTQYKPATQSDAALFLSIEHFNVFAQMLVRLNMMYLLDSFFKPAVASVSL